MAMPSKMNSLIENYDLIFRVLINDKSMRTRLVELMVDNELKDLIDKYGTINVMRDAILDYMLKYGNIELLDEYTTKWHTTDFNKYLRPGNSRKVDDYLISKGADNFSTVMEDAIKNNDLERIEYFISNGATNHEYNMISAIENRRINIIEYLLDLMKDVDYSYMLFRSILSNAGSKIENLFVEGSDREIVLDYLISYAEDDLAIDYIEKNKIDMNTVLNISVDNEDWDMTNYTLNGGANNIENAVDKANHYSYHELADYIENWKK